MNQNLKILIKLGRYLGFALFAGWSAYLTTTSMHLRYLSTMPFALAYIMIFAIACFAGWCLTLVVKEVKNQTNPSKSKFILGLLGFIVFWGISIATNIHYLYVTEHGYDTINRQVQSCITYLREKTDGTDSEYDTEKAGKKEKIAAKVGDLVSQFESSLTDAREGRLGFGDDCISKLRAIENVFLLDTNIYHDAFDYTIFNETADIGDRGVNQYNRFSQLQNKYETKIMRCLEQKYSVIDRYYDSQKANTDNLKEVLAEAKKLEAKSLPQLKDNKDFTTFYNCYSKDVASLLSKMPKDYFASNIKYKTKKDGTKVADGYVVYPIDRMFDVKSVVLEDMFAGNLPENQSLVMNIILAIIFDLIAFLFLL